MRLVLLASNCNLAENFFYFRPQRNVVSHQPLLNGQHPHQFSGVKRQALPSQQQQPLKHQQQQFPQQISEVAVENDARVVPAQVAIK